MTLEGRWKERRLVAITRYSLDAFIHDMTGLVAGRPDQRVLFERGSVYLERLVREPEVVPEHYRLPSAKGRRANHGSYLLHRGPGLLVTSVVWGPGDHVDPHDHHTWGMIGVCDNGIQETRFRRVEGHSREGFATLQREREAFVKQGEVTLLIPEVDEIHQMDNFGDRPTVEIHVYGGDLDTIERCQYDPLTGQIKRLVSGKFDNC